MYQAYAAATGGSGAFGLSRLTPGEVRMVDRRDQGGVVKHAPGPQAPAAFVPYTRLSDEAIPNDGPPPDDSSKTETGGGGYVNPLLVDTVTAQKNKSDPVEQYFWDTEQINES